MPPAPHNDRSADHHGLRFEDLGRRRQLRRVRDAAQQALAAFGVRGASLRLVNHDFNTTYRVTTGDGAVFALRINLNSAYDAGQGRAEVEWVEELHGQDDFDVPRARRTGDGATVVEVDIDGFDRPRPAVLYSWLPGVALAARAPRSGYQQLGRAMAALHDHTDRWSGTSTARRPTMNSILLDDPDRIRPGHAWLDGPTQTYLTSVLDELDRVLTPVFDAPRQLVHGDLHGDNVKWTGGRVGIFDFDDCGFATRLQDLTISTFYVRDEPILEEALLAGYQSVCPLPAHTTEQFEALIAARNMVLLNYVLGSVTAEMTEFAPGYIAKTVRRFEHYEDTGRFELS